MTDRPLASPPLLQIERLAKSFGATAALKDATFTARAGEVHALMGENGAGKSTTLGILAGLLTADRGSVLLDGAPYAPKTAAQARAHGVVIVPQEPTLCEHLDVIENVTLGVEPARGGFVRRDEATRMFERAIKPLNVTIDGQKMGAALTPAEKQLVCIARALAQGNARILILDEPTSSLTLSEAEHVLEAVRALAASGLCILYVSHTLGEVVRVSDAFTVLRNGETVRSAPMEGVTIGALTELLLGHPAKAKERKARDIGAPALSAKALEGVRLPKDATFELRRGEILGVFGLVGSGRTELVRALFGLDRVVRGEVRIGSVSSASSSPAARLAERVGMVSEDRKGEGLALGMTIADNLTLSKLEPVSKGGFVGTAAQEKVANELIARLGVRCPGPEAPVSSLSGGNQQKVAIGRMLHHDVDILLLDEPTRGIDIQSREQLYELATGLAAQGKAILWISTQPAELLAVSDRVAVMRRGTLGEPHDVTKIDEHKLLEEAAS